MDHPPEAILPDGTAALPLAPGDIVMCRFPSAEGRREVEKTRPCLVLAVGDADITLAYGTTRESHLRRGRELHLVRTEEIAAAGLWRPTRFLGWRTARIARASARLRPAPRGGAVCGRLTGRSRRALTRLRALAEPAETPRKGRRARPPHLGGPHR
jgi:hypothetical protein